VTVPPALAGRGLSPEERARIKKDIMKSLESLSLLDDFRLDVRSTRSSLIVVIAPKERVNVLDCVATTVRGNQCKLTPEPGEKYCLVHLKMMEEK